MFRVFSLAAVILLTQYAAMAPARADKDKEGEKFVRVGVIIGKILNITEGKRRLKIQVSIPLVKLDQGAVGQMTAAEQQMARAQVQMRAARNPTALNQARQQLVQAQTQYIQAAAKLYRTETVNRDFEVQAIDDVVVRTTFPKQDFDDKGEIKKYTKAELKEMRGDGKLPGFKAEFGDLATQQIVRVVLVRKPVVVPAKKEKGDKEPDGLADSKTGTLPLVSIIEIVVDPPPR